MDVKEYLQSIAKRERKLEAMKQNHDQLLRIAEGGGTPKTDTLPGSPSSDGSAMANLVCRAVDLEDRIKAEEESLARDKCLILEALGNLPDAEPQMVVMYRYFDGLRWSEIAQNLNCSERWVFRLHGQALEALRCRLSVVV